MGSIVVRLGFLGTEEDKAEAARREANIPMTPFLDRVAGSWCEGLISPAIGKHLVTRGDAFAVSAPVREPCDARPEEWLGEKD